MKRTAVAQAIGGLEGCQSGTTTDGGTHPRRESPRAAHLQPVLVTDEQAAAMWQVGKTVFYELRASGADWFPRPVQLGPRTVRYVRSEVEQAVLHMPRMGASSEPARLARARIERQKRTGMPA
jgi:predicted DNA-binding transcriptional regulator AlpA